MIKNDYRHKNPSMCPLPLLHHQLIHLHFINSIASQIKHLIDAPLQNIIKWSISYFHDFENVWKNTILSKWVSCLIVFFASFDFIFFASVFK